MLLRGDRRGGSVKEVEGGREGKKTYLETGEKVGNEFSEGSFVLNSTGYTLKNEEERERESVQREKARRRERVKERLT